MSKFWPYLEKVLIALFAVAAVGFYFVPNYHGGRNHLPPNVTKKKMCMANMKTIEGALELYFMENKYQDGSVAGVNELKNKGYLKSTMTCPSQPGAFDYITSSRQSLDQKVISDVECSIHGKVSLQDSTDKNKGL